MTTPTSGSTYSLFSPTGNANLDALLGGTRWGPVALRGSLTLGYSFPTSDSALYWSTEWFSGYGTSSFGEPWNDFHALTSVQRTQVRNIFTMIDSYTKLNLVEVGETTSSVGDIRLAFSGAVSYFAAAHAYSPSGTYYTSTLQGNAYANAGDVWVNSDDYGSFAPTTGSYDYLTLIHEIGHALGLKHTFQADGAFNAINPARDSYRYSVMSYSAVAGDQDSWMSYYPTTLMSYDVYALQYLYGKNTSYHTGNDTYTFVAGRDYNQVIWDAGGNDTIVYSEGSTSVCRINLNAGAWQDLGNSLTYHSGGATSTSVYNVQILAGVTIENATGGGGADTLTGNAVANKLTGNGGNDTLSGGAGNDTLNGGSGNDSMSGGDGSDTYYCNSTLDKIVETNASASGGGSDLVWSYLSTYTLGANVENGRIVATGTASLTGNGLNNVIYAGSGNNVMNGGSGTDTVSYIYASAAVKVSLATASVQTTGGSGSETLSSIERLYGSGYNDTLSGGSGANLLYGAAGNDRLSGAAGNDILRGSAGNDTLTGGTGADCFRFDSALNASTNRDSITDFSPVDDTFQLENSVFTRLTATGTLSASYFRSGAGVTAAVDGNDYLIYNTTTGYLYYDADGSGSGSSAIPFAVVGSSTHAALTNADLVVV